MASEQKAQPLSSLLAAEAQDDPERFGDYELIEEIAHGGMGVVFKARQVALNRLVALKMIRADRLAREEDILRFHTEAEAAANLQHPGIVAIHEVGQVRGQHFYSMDYVAGESLSQMVREHPLPPARAARYVREIARAIHYAHTQGILHRDLKPSNVLVDLNDEPRVTDFGLAKVMQADTGLTLSGTVMGSPSYMSPEQARGRNHEVGVRSDVYAMGAILYELLCGRPPFQADSTVEILRQVSEVEAVSPRLLNPKLPRDLETVCLKCLDKTPARRYASAAELADELGRFIEGEPIHARPIGRLERGWRWCRRKPVIAGLGATVLVVAVTGFIAVLMQWQRAEFEKRQNRERLTRLHRSNGIQRMEAGDLLGSLPSLVEALRLEDTASASEEIARIRIGSVLQVAPKLRQMWFHKDFVVWAAFSPDGQRALTAGKDGDAVIWDINSGQAVAPVLAAGVPILHAEFSFDGNRVVVTYADQTARVWDAHSGALIGSPLRHNAGQRQGRMRAIFSRDGQWVLTTSDRIAQLWNAQTSVSRYAITNTRPINYANFHPDGRSFTVACSDGKAWVRSVESGEPTFGPLQHTRSVEQVKFSPDGRRLVTVCADNTAHIWDAGTGQKLGVPLYISAILPEEINAVDGTASFSPDSRLLVTTGTDRTARVWDVETGVAVSQPLAHTHSVVQASFSPDGRFVMTSSHDHSARVWDVSSSKLIMVLPHNGFVVCSAFSPSGAQILTAGQDNVAKLWDITGAHSPLPPMEHSRNIECFAFSPDGKFVATGGADQLLHVWNAHTGAKHITLAHTGTVKAVAFTSDSRLLVSAGGERTAILWETASGKRLQTFRHVRTVNVACLSPDGRLLLTAGNGGMVQLCEIATGRVIFGDPKVHRETVLWAAFSPNGEMFVTASADRTAQIRKSSTGELVCAPLIHQTEVRHAVFSPDSRKLLTACADNDPIFYLPCAGQLWDVSSGKKFGPPLQHTDGVLRGAFSPNGKYAATVSEDGSACIWDAASGELRIQPLKHRFHVLSVEFSRDGRLLLTAGRDGTARLWDVETGEPAMPPLVLPAIRARASFGPDGSRFATATDQKQVWLWKLPREQRSAEELALLGQLLTGHRLDPLSGPAPLDTEELKGLWERYRETAAADDKSVGTLAWHLLQADYCRFQQQWTAALFHLDRLLLEDPGNSLYIARHAEVRAALQH